MDSLSGAGNLPNLFGMVWLLVTYLVSLCHGVGWRWSERLGGRTKGREFRLKKDPHYSR